MKSKFWWKHFQETSDKNFYIVQEQKKRVNILKGEQAKQKTTKFEITKTAINLGDAENEDWYNKYNKL